MMDEPLPSPSGVEDVRATLFDIVREGQSSRAEPIHLTWVGGEFARRKHAPFEPYLNHLVLAGQADIPAAERKMAPFIERHCADILHTSKLTNGAVTVAPVPPRAAAPLLASTTPPTPMTYKFRKGAWLAFVRPLESGSRRFLNLDRIGFTDSSGAVPDAPGTWKEIGREFILGTAPDQPIDGSQVQQRIRAWTAACGVAIEQLVDGGEPVPGPGRPSLGDLARLIDSLPTEVARTWMIPAEVLRHLRRA